MILWIHAFESEDKFNARLDHVREVDGEAKKDSLCSNTVRNTDIFLFCFSIVLACWRVAVVVLISATSNRTVGKGPVWDGSVIVVVDGMTGGNKELSMHSCNHIYAGRLQRL